MLKRKLDGSTPVAAKIRLLKVETKSEGGTSSWRKTAMPPGILTLTSTTLVSVTWTNLSPNKCGAKRVLSPSPMATPLKSSLWFAEGIPNFQEISALRRTVVSRELNMRILCPMFDNSRTDTGVVRKVVREMLAVSVSALV
jgi:hypothetical protein